MFTIDLSSQAVHRRRALVAQRRLNRSLAGAAVVTVVASIPFASPRSAWTTLHVETWTAAEIQSSYVDNTYNFHAEIYIGGPNPIRIVATRLRNASPGLIGREPVVAWKCGDVDPPNESAAADDIRYAPGQRGWLATERPVRAAEGRCPYLYLRIVPTRKGTLRLSGFDIDYRVGSMTRTFRLDYEITLRVTHEGIDDRTISQRQQFAGQSPPSSGINPRPF